MWPFTIFKKIDNIANTFSRIDARDMKYLREEQRIEKKLKELELKIIEINNNIEIIKEELFGNGQRLLQLLDKKQVDYNTVKVFDFNGKEIDENESPEKVIDVWCIEPHECEDYSYCVVRDYNEALKIAKRTLEGLTNQLDTKENSGVNVYLFSKKMTVKEYNDILLNTH